MESEEEDHEQQVEKGPVCSQIGREYRLKKLSMEKSRKLLTALCTRRTKLDPGLL